MNKLYCGIDPGTEHTGCVVLSRLGESVSVVHKSVMTFEKTREWIWQLDVFPECLPKIGIEMVACYGMPVGADVFNTAAMVGRYEECILVNTRGKAKIERVTRNQVKMHLCHHVAKVNDGVVRQAIIDRFGGEKVAIGAVKCHSCSGKKWIGRQHSPCTACNETGWDHPPGPLHGITSHMWPALAVALYVMDNDKSPEQVSM